jgi:multidrug efflux system outer membrane protein
MGVPPAFKSVTGDEARPPKLSQDWWKLFGDPELARLEEAAIQANPDLQAAMARVIEAREASRITESQFYPTLTSGPFATRQRAVGSLNSNQGAVTFNTFQVPLDLSYQVDLWGKIRRNYESSEAQARASGNDYFVVLHTLETDLASDYFTLRSLDSQVETLAKTVVAYRQTLDLTQTQYKAGLVGPINVAQAEAQLYSTMTQEHEARRQRTDLEHAIAILMGRPPSEFALAPQPLNQAPPAVPAGVPADLLRHRPDVAEAEENLIAACAQIGVAKASYYPSLTLTGMVGLTAGDITKFFNWSGRIWSIGASSLVPIYEGGLLDATYAQAKARYDEMLAAYRSKLLGAFRDVEDALTDIHLRAEEEKAQSQAVKSSREYLRLAEVQYKGGLTSYLQVIDAQRTLLSNELLYEQILSQQLSSTLMLIKAVGAGWDAEIPPPPPPGN